MQKFLVLGLLAILLAGCVSNGDASYHVHQGGGGSDKSAKSAVSSGQSQAESQAASDPENPGETEGSEVKDDNGNGLGFSSNSG